MDAWSTVENRLKRMNAQIVAAKRDYAELKKEYDDILKNYQKQMAPYQAKKKDMEGDLDPEALEALQAHPFRPAQSGGTHRQQPVLWL